MARRASLRASDSDREQVAERLRHAAAEGRLMAEELELRLARAFRARTYAELDPLVSDLPHTRGGLRRRTPASPLVMAAVAAAAVVAALAIVAMVVMVLTGLFAAWMMWAVVAWWFFGRGHRHHRGHRSHRPGPRMRVANRRAL